MTCYPNLCETTVTTAARVVGTLPKTGSDLTVQATLIGIGLLVLGLMAWYINRHWNEVTPRG